MPITLDEHLSDIRDKRILYERRFMSVRIKCEHSVFDTTIVKLDDTKCTHTRNDIKTCRFSACPYYLSIQKY